MNRVHKEYKRFHVPVKNAAIGFLVAYLAFWVVQLGWWEFFPYKTADVTVPIEVVNDGLPELIDIDGQQVQPVSDDNHNETVKRGEHLKLLLQFTKHTQVSPNVSRNIVCENGAIYFVASSASGSTRPVGTFIAKPMYALDPLIPNNVPCYFQFTNVYNVSPLRTVTKVWQSEPFRIVE